MGSVRQGHEREKGPVIVRGRVGALFSAEPSFYLGSSGKIFSLRRLLVAERDLPGMVKADHAN